MKLIRCPSLFALIFLSSIHISGQPVINSISPTYGPIGSTVIIAGNNFSNIPLNNIAYFGGVKAQVINSTTFSLTVMVPYGATHDPITVLTNNQIAYSNSRFSVTFESTGLITPATFAFNANNATANNPTDLATGDLDGDGKTDVVIVNNDASSFSVFRNISTPGSFTFEPKVDHAMGLFPQSVNIGDVDGDGKLDVIVTITSPALVSIFRNISSVGNIVFAPKTDLTTGTDPHDVAVGDFDADGKTDLAVVNYNGFSISIFKNTGSAGNIQFDSRFDLSTGNLYPVSIATVDLNGDGFTEIAVSAYNSILDSLFIFANTSTKGQISFAGKISYAKARGAEEIVFGDLDADGRLDLATACWVSSKISVFKNTSANGVVSLAAKSDFVTGKYPESMSIGDINGDSKPDLCVANYLGNNVSVLQNISEGENIAFKSPVNYPTAEHPVSVKLIDLDADGKPDAITVSQSNNISLIRNTLSSIIQMCADSTAMLVTNTTGTNYQWQQITDDSVFNNIGDNSNYAGTNTNSLRLQNIPSSWYGYQYRCLVSGIGTDVFTIHFSNSWNGAADNSWENPDNWSCGILPDENTDIVIRQGTVILNSNATVRSLTIKSPASFTIISPYNIIVRF